MCIFNFSNFFIIKWANPRLFYCLFSVFLFFWCVLISVRPVWQKLQEELNAVHSPPDPLGHSTLSLPILRQEIPPEVGHEEAHLHTHRFVHVGFE